MILTLLIFSPMFDGIPSYLDFVAFWHTKYKGNFIAYSIMVPGLCMFTEIIFIIVSITMIKRCCQANAMTVSSEFKKESIIIIIMTLLVLLGVPWSTAAFVYLLFLYLNFKSALAFIQCCLSSPLLKGLVCLLCNVWGWKLFEKKGKNWCAIFCSKTKNTVYEKFNISRSKETTI